VQLQREGKINSDIYASRVIDTVLAFRDNLAQLCRFDWVPVPLAYPQVVFLSVHVYFFICIFSRQFIVTERNVPNKSTVDLRIPIMTMLQFIFYVGWMKVSESLLNPFGEDDDDFECNFLIDKNFATSMCIADDAQNGQPALLPDKFFGSADVEAFYPKESKASIPVHPLVGSAVAARVQEDEDAEVEMTPLVVEDDENPDAVHARKNSVPENYGVKHRSASTAIRDTFRSLSTVDRPRFHHHPHPHHMQKDPENCISDKGHQANNKNPSPLPGQHRPPSPFHLSTVLEDEAPANEIAPETAKEK